VNCRVNGPATGSCVIKEMVQNDLLQLSGFHASDPWGNDLPWVTRPDTAMGSAAKNFVDRVITLEGLRKFSYGYRVTPGAWIGNDVRGSHATRFGYLDAHGGLLSGRNLFLLPAAYESISEMGVTFHLPAGWRTWGTVT